MEKSKNFIPLLINLKDKRVLIVGGGNAALLKAKGLYRFTSTITILAPEIKEELLEYPFNFITRSYQPDLLEEFNMVYCCTNDYDLNQKIAADCKKTNKLCSICDNPNNSIFVSPAIYKEENITISIGTNGNSPKQAIYIRNQIKALIEQGILKTEYHENK